MGIQPQSTVISALRFVATILCALVGLSAAFADPLRPPFYFSVPAASLKPMPELQAGRRLPTGEEVSFAECREFTEGEAGLRVIEFGADPKTRKEVCARLERAGLIKPGDVILTFRPDWADTMPYPHVQMGTSHAGLLYAENGSIYSLDMPLDAEHNRDGFRTRLDSPHYLGVDSFHILRPRGFDSSASTRLSGWVSTLRGNITAIRNAGYCRFNSDYLSPRPAALNVSPGESVRIFSRILKKQSVQTSSFQLFCSEFVWHMLSLAKSADVTSGLTSPESVQYLFAPQRFLATSGVPGLTEGPLLVLNGIRPRLAMSQQASFARSVFADGNAATLSPGHRAVSASTAGLLKEVDSYYQFLLNGDARASEIAARLNASGPPNYSPTSFMVNALLPLDHPERKLDYLFTVRFQSN